MGVVSFMLRTALLPRCPPATCGPSGHRVSQLVIQLTSNHLTDGAIATHINKSLVRFIV